jgi:hypothetical protein
LRAVGGIKTGRDKKGWAERKKTMGEKSGDTGQEGRYGENGYGQKTRDA